MGLGIWAVTHSLPSSHCGHCRGQTWPRGRGRSPLGSASLRAATSTSSLSNPTPTGRVGPGHRLPASTRGGRLGSGRGRLRATVPSSPTKHSCPTRRSQPQRPQATAGLRAEVQMPCPGEGPAPHRPWLHEELEALWLRAILNRAVSSSCGPGPASPLQRTKERGR